MSIKDRNDCDQFIEEECDYFGKVIIKTQEGLITDPDSCQGICENNQEDVVTPCKYWIYDNIVRVCTLLDSADYECKGESGKKEPKYDTC